MMAMLFRVYPQAALAALVAAVACNAAVPAGQKQGEPESASDADWSEANRGEEGAADDGVAPVSDRLLVETHDGKVRGISADGVDQFLGIPYAAPPVGERRLAPTAVPDPWKGERQAVAARSVCPQLVNGAFVGDEDCLYLNVHRPANADRAKDLPVVVWIHGGSFKSGAGSEYDPRRLVTTNSVIVVTINYRLGPLGFLAADGLSGDYGFQDQLAALGWVQANIGAFGGAADQVTIQGESAGGASVCSLLTSSAAAGMFSRAIIQSASCSAMTLDFAKAEAGVLAKQLGCTSEPASCLKSTSLEAKEIVRVSEQIGMLYGAVAGSGVLPSAPFDSIVRQQYSKVPVLIGGITDEMSFFMALDSKLLNSLWRGYPALLADWFPKVDTNAIAEEYPLARYDNQAFFALSAALNDSGVYYGQALGGCVTAKVAAALSASTATYSYELDDPSFTWKNGNKGASHTSDLPYLFDLANPLSQPLSQAQSTLAGTMVESWGAFIRGAPPSSSWPRYTTAAPSSAARSDTAYFEPGARPATIHLREKHHCAFWDELCGSQSERCPRPAP
jgi:para-nitrobenzyl esterase